MTADRQTELAKELAAALEWWRKAGVDNAFHDEAAGWLTDPAEETGPVAAAAHREDAPARPAPPKLRLGGATASWPTDLPGFRRWWLFETSLCDEGTYPRIGPRGEPGAELLLLVAQPEECDRETLLAGPQGRLLGAMLQAMGVPEERAYFASALPRHTPLPDWESLQTSGLREIVAHHVAIAAPARIVAFGRVASALVSHDPAQDAAPLRFFNHGGTMVPVMNAEDLEALLRRPRARATFWRRWLELTDGTG